VVGVEQRAAEVAEKCAAVEKIRDGVFVTPEKLGFQTYTLSQMLGCGSWWGIGKLGRSEPKGRGVWFFVNLAAKMADLCKPEVEIWRKHSQSSFRTELSIRLL